MHLDIRFEGAFPIFAEFFKSSKLSVVLSKNSKIMPNLIKFGQQNREYFKDALTKQGDPRVVPKKLNKDGHTPNNSATTRIIEINVPLLKGHHFSKMCEKAYRSLAPDDPIRKKHPRPQFTWPFWEKRIITTLLHEMVHFANHDAGLVIDESGDLGDDLEKEAGLETPSIPDSALEEDHWAVGQLNTMENPLMAPELWFPRRPELWEISF